MSIKTGFLVLLAFCLISRCGSGGRSETSLRCEGELGVCLAAALALLVGLVHAGSGSVL